MCETRPTHEADAATNLCLTGVSGLDVAKLSFGRTPRVTTRRTAAICAHIGTKMRAQSSAHRSCARSERLVGRRALVCSDPEDEDADSRKQREKRWT